MSGERLTAQGATMLQTFGIVPALTIDTTGALDPMQMVGSRQRESPVDGICHAITPDYPVA